MMTEPQKKITDFKIEEPSKSSNLIWLWVIGGLTISGIGLIGIIALLSAIILPNLFNSISKARENEAQEQATIYLRTQQAFYLEEKRFTNQLDKLKATLKKETNNYNYKMDADQNKAFIVATPKKTALKTYIGALFVIVPGDNPLIISGICQSQQPSQTVDKLPKISSTNNKEIQCPPGSILLPI